MNGRAFASGRIVHPAIYWAAFVAALVLLIFDIRVEVTVGLSLAIAWLLTRLADRDIAIQLPLIIFLLAYLLAYPAAIFQLDLERTTAMSRVLTEESMIQAELWAARGLAAFAVCYLVVAHYGRNRTRRALYNPYPTNSGDSHAVALLTLLGATALAGALGSWTVFGRAVVFMSDEAQGVERGSGTMYQLLYLMGMLKYSYVAGFLIIRARIAVSRSQNLLFAALVAIWILEVVTIGAKDILAAGVISFAFGSTLSGYRWRPRKALVFIAGGVLVFMSFSIVGEYRTSMIERSNHGADIFALDTQLIVFAESVKAVLLPDDSGRVYEEPQYLGVYSRLSTSGVSFANLLTFTEYESPYENALTTFLLPAYALLPRALTPGKPEFFHSGRNAREYYGWSFGGISVTMLGSLYYSWGFIGIIAGMGVVGMSLYYVSARSAPTEGDFMAWLPVLIMLVIMLADPGMTFHAVVTNILRVVIIVQVLSYFAFMRAKRA